MSQNCPGCGFDGSILHQNVGDYFFGHDGSWCFRKCGNDECGLVWIDPLPLAEKLPNYYQGYYTHDAGGLKAKLKSLLISIIAPAVIDRCSANRWSQEFASLVGQLYPRVEAEAFYGLGSVRPFGERRMLDIGCGNGERLPLFSTVGWSHVAGIDVDSDAIHSAQTLGRDVKFGSMDSIPYESETFDFLFLHHVVEHVYSVEEGLRECFRVLRPGGMVYILTPNANSRLHRYYGKYWRGLEAPRHLRIQTKASLKRALSISGFYEERVETIDRSHNWLAEECGNAMLKYDSSPTQIEIQEFNLDNGEEVLALGKKL